MRNREWIEKPPLKWLFVDPGGSCGLECVLPTAGADRANDADERLCYGNGERGDPGDCAALSDRWNQEKVAGCVALAWA
jgi:hypothetical protein